MSLRKLIFWIHLCAGCFSGAVILFLSLTGCMLTYERQIIAFAERGYRSGPPAGSAQPMSLQDLMSLAKNAEGKSPSSIVVPSDNRDPIEIDFGRDKRLFLNRYTGVVLGSGAVGTRSFFATVTGLHRWFGASSNQRPVARAVKGVFTFALLLMILTGLCLWWPSKWSWPRVRNGAFFRSGLTGRAWDWNRHNVLGIWAALPLILIVITGLILAYPWATNLLYRVTGSTVPNAPAGESQKHEAKTKEDSLPQNAFLGIDQLYASARQQAIGERSLTAILPKSSDRKMTFLIDFDGGGRPDQRAQLVFDRTTGAVVKLETFSSYSLGKRLRMFVKFIHTGEAGGWFGQTLSGLASLACAALVWTGLAMFVRRVRAWAERKQQKEVVAMRS